jgi:uncharacterized protein (DUF2141 family)
VTHRTPNPAASRQHLDHAFHNSNICLVRKRRRSSGLQALSVALVTISAHAEATAPPPATTTIRVNVGQFRNNKGALGCRLYHAAQGFPSDPAGAVESNVPIAGKQSICEFSAVAAGTYAIAVIHDENSNRRLDTNWLGIPVEGYGASNNHTHTFSAPTWTESKFSVDGARPVSIEIQLHY